MNKKSLTTIENKYYKSGCNIIAGIDEAGRGAWVGPVAIGICIFPNKYNNKLINDSKKISAINRKKIFEIIKKDALYWNVILIDNKKIDKNGINNVIKDGMITLIKNIPTNIMPNCVLIDYVKISNIDKNILIDSFPKADEKSISVAAASIIAKVTRDEFMEKLSKKYINFSFDKHKGYGTKKHIDELKKFGVIKNIYRLSYEPIKELLNNSKNQ